MLAKIKHFCAFWLRVTRAYALGMTIMSWGVVFIWGIFDKGNILLGLLCLIGLLFAHLGTNLLDDYLDFKKNTEIVKNLKEKCWFLKSNALTLHQTLLAICTLFFIASIIGLYLTIKIGPIVAIIATFSAILCLFYTKATYIGLGEVIIGLLFSPCLYLGTYYVMTKSFSLPLMLISISTALLTIGVLHTHTMMDFECDKQDKKITLSHLLKTSKNAFLGLNLIIFGAFFNIILLIIFKILPPVFLLVFLSLPIAIQLYKIMKTWLYSPTQTLNANFWMGPMEALSDDIQLKNFMIRFYTSRNLMMIFAIFLCIAKAFDSNIFGTIK